MFDRHTHRFALLMALVLSCRPGQLSAEELAVETGSRNTNSGVAELLAQAEDRSLGGWERDAKGDVVSVNLYSPFANDVGLDLFSTLGSVQKLRLQTTRRPPELTRAGISSLGRMTNLTSLSFACGGLLKNGVFDEVCKLKGLRELNLTLAYPPSGEYTALTNLQNLVSLRVGYCTNFGDNELSMLTNLPSLKSLTLYADGFSKEATNVLRCMTGLTNVAVKVSQPGTPAK